MKKILYLLFISTAMLYLTACSNSISQTRYDILLAENENLKAENKSLSSQIEQLESEKLELTKSAVTLISENAEVQSQDIDREYNEKFVNLIIDEIYDENCDFVIVNDTLHVNVYYDQEYSYELFQKMVDECNSFSALYQATIPSVSDISENLLSFDYIAMYCWDASSTRVVSTLYSSRDDEITLTDLMCNNLYVIDILENFEQPNQ